MREKTVLALGFFDGVHIGHGALLQCAKNASRTLDAKPCVLTFDRHPKLLVSGDTVPLLTDVSDRIELIRRYYGIDTVFVLNFNRETMRMPWKDFLDRSVSEYGAAGFVAGYDFRFGFKGEGNAERLKEYCREKGFFCEIIPAVTVDGETVSSSAIRRLIADGDVKTARRYLGHPYRMSGLVQEGFHVGRKLEAPTVNLVPGENAALPRCGVYATAVNLSDRALPAVTNVGTRPTFGRNPVTVESHLLSYNGNLYGQRISVEFYDFLRPERRFESPQALMEQIRQDAAKAGEIMGACLK